jgi:hypothetical protein
MGVVQPGLIIFAALFAMVGLYLLAKGPTVWRATAFLPLLPVLMCLLSSRRFRLSTNFTVLPDPRQAGLAGATGRHKQ